MSAQAWESWLLKSDLSEIVWQKELEKLIFMLKLLPRQLELPIQFKVLLAMLEILSTLKIRKEKQENACEKETRISDS
jgi:hypothetical protein